MEHHIGALPRTPFPASRDFPSRGNERYEGKTASHILQVPFRRFPPLVAGATTIPPQAGALCVLSHGAMSLQESIETYSAPCIGGSPAQPDRGRRAQRASQQNAFHDV